MATKLAVTWDNSTKSNVVDLQGLDVVGFWDRDDKLVGTALTITTDDDIAGGTESDPVADYGDATTALTIDLDAAVHNYILIPANRLSGVLRFVWFTSTATEGDVSDDVAYLIVRDFR